jgi:chromosome segregation ATPase
VATQRDNFIATVTVEGSKAVQGLSTLSRKAKETDAALGGVGKKGKGDTTEGLDTAAGASSNLAASLSATSKTLAGIGLVAGTALPVAIGLVHGSVDAASDLNEALNAAQVTFKGAGDQAVAFADHAATGLGLSRRAALEAQTGFGVLFTGIGFTEQAALGFSQTLTRLAGDLASTFGGSVEEASNALRAMFRGETDPIERYGVKVNATTVEQRALALGLARTSSELSEQDKTLARLLLTIDATADASGDFQRTQADLANQQRVLAAETENAKASLGAAFTPVLTENVRGVNAVLGGLDTALRGVGGGADDLVRGFVGVIPVVGGVSAGLDLLGRTTGDGKGQFDGFSDALAVYQQHVIAGTQSSKEAQAALAYLKAETSKAEQVTTATTAALQSEADRLAQVRADADKARSSISSFLGAQRAAEDASLAVGDAQRRQADAQKGLNDLLARGKVDQEAVAQAESRAADAAERVADAQQRHSDAQRDLNELLARGKVNADEVARAERSLTQALRSQVDAQERLAEAQAEVDRLRAGPTDRESSDTDRAVERARLRKQEAEQEVADAARELNKARGSGRAEAERRLRQAQLDAADAADALADAEKARIDLAERGTEGSKELTDAERKVADAQQAITDANDARTRAEEAARTARAGDPDFEEKVAEKRREVAAASREIATATTERTTADAAARKARAGDPDYEQKLAEKRAEVAKTTNDYNRALQDLPLKLDAARSKQDELNASLAAGNQLLRDQAALAGILPEPPRAGPGGTILGSDVPAGPVPVLHVGGGTGARFAAGALPPMQFNLHIDGERFATVVTNHQERNARNGGARVGR